MVTAVGGNLLIEQRPGVKQAVDVVGDESPGGGCLGFFCLCTTASGSSPPNGAIQDVLLTAFRMPGPYGDRLAVCREDLRLRKWIDVWFRGDTDQENNLWDRECLVARCNDWIVMGFICE